MLRTKFSIRKSSKEAQRSKTLTIIALYVLKVPIISSIMVVETYEAAIFGGGFFFHHQGQR